MSKTLLGFIFVLIAQASAAQDTASFSPRPGIMASIYLEDSTLKIELTGHVNKQQLLSPGLPTTARLTTRRLPGSRQIYLEAWHPDEGMGTYTIHHLFYYQPATQQFVERHPICGEQFINLQPQGQQRRLIYSAFDAASNRWHRCSDH